MNIRSFPSLGTLVSTALFAAVATSWAFAQGVAPSSGEMTYSQSATFSAQSGEALFAKSCQACHMEGGRGAAGAGSYPALARNSNLVASGYPVNVVLHGLKGMPPMAKMMSDEQIAAVVNYVRTHFGNAYQDSVTVQDVSGAR